MLLYCYDVINANTNKLNNIKHKNVLNYKYCKIYKCVMNELLHLCDCKEV